MATKKKPQFHRIRSERMTKKRKIFPVYFEHDREGFVTILKVHETGEVERIYEPPEPEENEDDYDSSYDYDLDAWEMSMDSVESDEREAHMIVTDIDDPEEAFKTLKQYLGEDIWLTEEEALAYAIELARGEA